jgi:hypothetical protein
MPFLSGFFPKTSIVATRPPMMDGPRRFTISGFSMPKCSDFLSSELPKCRILKFDGLFPFGTFPEPLDFYHVSQQMDGPDQNRDFLYEVTRWSFPPYRGFGLRGSKMRVLPVFRIRETSNPEMPMDSSIGIFPEFSDFRHASSQDGQSLIISRFQKSDADVLLSSQTSNSDMRNADGLLISATCPNGRTTQICFGVFTMEIPDLLSSRLLISRSLKSRYPDSFGTFTLLFTKFKPRAAPVRSEG